MHRIAANGRGFAFVAVFRDPLPSPGLKTIRIPGDQGLGVRRHDAKPSVVRF